MVYYDPRAPAGFKMCTKNVHTITMQENDKNIRRKWSRKPEKIKNLKLLDRMTSLHKSTRHFAAEKPFLCHF